MAVPYLLCPSTSALPGLNILNYFYGRRTESNDKSQQFEQPGTIHAGYFFFFLLLLPWSNIKITTCFREVVDRIFNDHLLIAHCAAGTAQSILHAISLLIFSAHLRGWHYYHVHFAKENPGHCESREFVSVPSAFKWKSWNLNPEPFLKLLCWYCVIWKGQKSSNLFQGSKVLVILLHILLESELTSFGHCVVIAISLLRKSK